MKVTSEYLSACSWWGTAEGGKWGSSETSWNSLYCNERKISISVYQIPHIDFRTSKFVRYVNYSQNLFHSLPECRNERSVKVTSSAHIC